MPAIDTTSAILTEETLGSATVVPPTYQGESTPRLSISTEARHLTFTPDLPSRATGLSRSRAVKTRRDGVSSVSYSSSSFSGVDSSSDKENTSSHNPYRYSEYSRSNEFSTLESYSRTTHTRTANDTPLPSLSSKHDPRSEGDPSTTDTPTSSAPFETALSPLIMSFASLPSIPSLYETAKVCSTESEATKSVSGDFKASPKVESVSDYITASVCKSEPPSPFATPEVCPTEVSTEYDDAECRCKPEKVVVSEGIQVAVLNQLSQSLHDLLNRKSPHPVRMLYMLFPLISVSLLGALSPSALPPSALPTKRVLRQRRRSPGTSHFLTPWQSLLSHLPSYQSLLQGPQDPSHPLTWFFIHCFSGITGNDTVTVVSHRIDSKLPHTVASAFWFRYPRSTGS
jgi:hypothetical protein